MDKKNSKKFYHKISIIKYATIIIEKCKYASLILGCVCPSVFWQVGDGAWKCYGDVPAAGVRLDEEIARAPSGRFFRRRHFNLRR